MYDELEDALNWEQRLPTLAREFGQQRGTRRQLCLFGPRYLTYLFSPQARRLEAQLRHFGHSHQGTLPEAWRTGWPGRDQERLYLLLEELSFQNPVLRRETNLEDTRAGIFRWSAGPIEVDLILPEEQRLSLMDPRLQALTDLPSLLIARVGFSHEQPVIRTMSLPESIKATQQAINAIKSALGVNEATVSENSTPQLPEIKRNEAPRRDAWIKA